MFPALLRYSKVFHKNHGCLEYMGRFRDFAAKRGGDKVYLDHVYKNEAALRKLLEESRQETPEKSVERTFS